MLAGVLVNLGVLGLLSGWRYECIFGCLLLNDNHLKYGSKYSVFVDTTTNNITAQIKVNHNDKNGFIYEHFYCISCVYMVIAFLVEYY